MDHGRSQYGRFEKEKHLFPLPGIEGHFLFSRPARSRATAPTELSRLLVIGFCLSLQSKHNTHTDFATNIYTTIKLKPFFHGQLRTISKKSKTMTENRKFPSRTSSDDPVLSGNVTHALRFPLLDAGCTLQIQSMSKFTAWS